MTASRILPFRGLLLVLLLQLGRTLPSSGEQRGKAVRADSADFAEEAPRVPAARQTFGKQQQQQQQQQQQLILLQKKVTLDEHKDPPPPFWEEYSSGDHHSHSNPVCNHQVKHSGKSSSNPSHFEFDEKKDHLGKEKLERLERAERDPILSENVLMEDPTTEVLSDLEGEDEGKSDPGVVFVVYHRTGSVFSRKALERFRELPGWHEAPRYVRNSDCPKFAHGSSSGAFYDHALPEVRSRTLSRVVCPDLSWPLPEGTQTRIVHWYRDPVDTILSAYRYHQNLDSAESWETVLPPRCNRCDEEAHAAIFEPCDYKCHYLDLVRKLPQSIGVKVEALDMREKLRRAVGNLKRWANQKQVLHLSIDKHIGQDFDKTVECLLRFLGIGDKEEQADERERFKRSLQELDLHRNDRLKEEKHATSGKHDNAHIRSLLEKHPTWGAEFRRAREMAQQVFERQGRQYGCPVPEHEMATSTSYSGTKKKLKDVDLV